MHKKNITLPLLLIIILAAALTPAAHAALAVTTNRTTYDYQETVTITITEASSQRKIMIQVNDPDGNPTYIAETTTDQTGQATYTFKVPNEWKEGQYTVLIKDTHTGNTDTTTFKIKKTVYVPPTLTPEEVEAMTDAVAAATLSDLPASEAASLMSEMSTDKAARIMDLMTTEVAANIVKDMTPGAAAEVLNQVAAKTAVNVLGEVPIQTAADVADEMDSFKLALVLEAAVDEEKTERFSTMINLMNENKAADALLEMVPEKGARIVEGMAQDNLHEAAKRVEAAVKKKLAEVDPEKAQEIINKIAGILENVETGPLVDIFIEIAGLPETPSTVAIVLEAMDLSKVLDVVTTWIEKGNLEELAQVYSYFTDAFLEDVWMGMTTAERNTLHPYLDTVTAERLPEIGEFQVSDLQVSPPAVAPGEIVTISVKVENVGNEAGMYTLTLKIDGTTVEITRVSLAPGEQQRFQWTVSRTQPKTYDVDVNGLKGSFTVVKPPTPAAFTFSGLVVSPADVASGAEVTVSVTVKNIGEQSGTYSAELKLDGATKETKTGTLAGGASTTVTFKVSSQIEGTHTVQVGTQTGSFKVTKPPPPDYTIYIVGIVAVIIIVAAIYFLRLRKPAV